MLTRFPKGMEGTPELRENYDYWQSQCELLGLAEVLWRIQGIEKAEGYSCEDVANTYPLLIEAMRADVGKGPAEKLR